MGKISPNDLIIEKLTDVHNVSEFDCGDSELNDFLFENSSPEMKAQINVTYVGIYKSRTVAYFTLSADSIKLNSDDKNHFEEKGIPYRQFPAIKIGRLAVDKRFQNRGIGNQLLSRIIGCSLKLNKRIGMRFISVDAYSKSVYFYEKNFFTEFLRKRDPGENVQMYFDLEPSRLVEKLEEILMESQTQLEDFKTNMKEELNEMLDDLKTRMDDLHNPSEPS